MRCCSSMTLSIYRCTRERFSKVPSLSLGTASVIVISQVGTSSDLG
jgi:hypothetical protein